MKKYEKIDELIEQVCDEEGVELEEIFDMPQEDNTNLINQFEEIFEVKLPDDFTYYLSQYGSGGLGYFDFFGIESGKDDVKKSTLALMTLECREKGMPQNFVVIEHGGDYVTCIATSKEDTSEIVKWSWMKGVASKIADSFEDYFMGKLEDCL